jgi:hypothetical protein
MRLYFRPSNSDQRKERDGFSQAKAVLKME